MAAIVSVVCARRPLSSSGRHPTAVGPLVHPSPPPPPPPLTPLPENRHPTDPLRLRRPPSRASGVNYWKIVGRSEILFLASRRQHGRDPSSVLYSAVPSGARLIYASSANVPSPPPSPRRPPETSPGARPLFRRARGMNFVSHALHFISQTSSHPCFPFLLLPMVYRLFRIHAFAI